MHEQLADEQAPRISVAVLDARRTELLAELAFPQAAEETLEVPRLTVPVAFNRHIALGLHYAPPIDKKTKEKRTKSNAQQQSQFSPWEST